MNDIKRRITELADLMSEFNLTEAKLEGEKWKVAFRKAAGLVEAAPTTLQGGHPTAQPAVAERPLGTPVSSPMSGVYYSCPSPGAPPYVGPGDLVTSGQVVGLIEAMKVFNELTAPISGIVSAVIAENGQLVQPGEPLMYIE